MEEQKGSKKAIIGVIVVVLLVVATTGAVMLGGRDSAKQATTSDTADNTDKPSDTTTSGSGTNNASTGNYKDGTYTATGKYQTPGGQESIDVKLTLASGVISDAVVTQNAISDEAHDYQAAFVSGYKSQVIGKKINDVSLSRVAGSSLTPGGFNSALKTIESDAAI